MWYRRIKGKEDKAKEFFEKLDKKLLFDLTEKEKIYVKNKIRNCFRRNKGNDIHSFYIINSPEIGISYDEIITLKRKKLLIFPIQFFVKIIRPN